MHMAKERDPNRKRVLYLITHGAMGGAQSHLLHLVSQLNRSFEIHVAMGGRGPLWGKLTDEGIPLHFIPSLVRDVAPVKDLKSLVEIVKLLRQVKPDLITIHSSKAGLLGRLASHICKVPAIFTAHGWAFTDGVKESKKRIYLMAETIAANWSEKIICVSDHDYQLACRLSTTHETQITTVHNGVPTGSGLYLAQPAGENPVRLIMVARFSEPKDHRLLLKAIYELQADKNFQLDLVGDGPLLSHYQKLVSQLKIDDRVRFLGARPDVPELLAKSQVFILASKWEGFPISILEAMRAGLPVIASDVGGTGEAVINDETGFLVPRDDDETLKSKLRLLINDSGLRVKMGKNGRERYLKNFTLDHMIKKTVAIYDEVLSQKKNNNCIIGRECKGRANG